MLRTLGVPTARGRHFTADETREGGPDVAMLSHETWQAVFAGRDLVGQTVSLNGRSWEVVGIMPPGFDVMDNKVEVWLPLRLDASNRKNRANHGLYLVGRLAKGRSMAEAQAEIGTLYARWEKLFPKTHKPSATFHQLQMEPAQAEIVGSASDLEGDYRNICENNVLNKVVSTTIRLDPVKHPRVFTPRRTTR